MNYKNEYTENIIGFLIHKYIIIINFIIVNLCIESFPLSTLVDGLSLEFEWQQVYASLQDSSHYSRVVWLVSTRPVISKFSNPCTNSLVIVPRAQL